MYEGRKWLGWHSSILLTRCCWVIWRIFRNASGTLTADTLLCWKDVGPLFSEGAPHRPPCSCRHARCHSVVPDAIANGEKEDHRLVISECSHINTADVTATIPPGPWTSAHIGVQVRLSRFFLLPVMCTRNMSGRNIPRMPPFRVCL